MTSNIVKFGATIKNIKIDGDGCGQIVLEVPLSDIVNVLNSASLIQKFLQVEMAPAQGEMYNKSGNQGKAADSKGLAEAY